MFKKNKQLLSVVLTLCMVVSMFLGNTVSANAADKEIKSATVISVPSINFEEPSDIAESQATFEVPEGCIAKSQWYIWDIAANEGDGCFVPVNSGKFTTTDIYYLSLSFEAAKGYVFSEDFDVIVPDGCEGSLTGTGESNDIIWSYDLPVMSAKGAIYQVNITHPEPMVGNIASTEEIAISFITGDSIVENPVFKSEINWICSSCNYEKVNGKAFETGHKYDLEIKLSAPDGYYFAESLYANHNGKVDDYVFESFTQFSLIDNYTVYEGPVLEEIVINGFPEVNAGETMAPETSYDIETLPEGVAVYIEWFDEDDNVVTGTNMEDGRLYTAQIYVEAKSGDITLTPEFEFIIDGSQWKPTILDDKNPMPLWAILELEYDLRDDVDADGSDNTNSGENTNTPNNSDVDSNTSEKPKTGDSSMMLLYAALAVVSIGAVVFVRKKR